VFLVSLQLLRETYFILSRTERDMISNIKLSSCKVPFIFVRFSWKLSFLDRVSENPQVRKFHENLSSGSRVPCGGTDRRSDMTMLIVAFRNFANAPIKYSQDIKWPGRESNQPFLEYNSGALLLHQSAQYLLELFPDNVNLINRIMK